MGHSPRAVRSTVAAACLLSMVGLPTAALAEPPPQAPAHGHPSREGAARSSSSVQASHANATADGRTTGGPSTKAKGTKANTTKAKGATAKDTKAKGATAKGGPSATQADSTRATASATQTDSTRASNGNDGKAKGAPSAAAQADSDKSEKSNNGKAKGRPSATQADSNKDKGPATDQHPGKGNARGRPDTAGPVEAVTSAPDPDAGSAAAPPDPGPAGPAQPAAPAQQAPVDPVVAQPVAAPQDTAPSAPTAEPPVPQAPVPAAAGAPAVIEAPPTRGVARGLGQVGRDVAEVIEGVTGRVGDLRIADLSPAITEPVARLVPLLLLLLGAFLALQRGIGRGLGHVPMVVTTHRRDVDEFV